MSALYSAIESQRTLGGRSAEAEWPPALTLAAAAAVTSHMKLAAAVLLLPLYSPLKLAEDTAVLDCLSNGRLIVGVAPGYVAEEFTAFGIPRAERFGRMWEALDLMKLAWTKDRFSYAAVKGPICILDARLSAGVLRSRISQDETATCHGR